MASTAASGGLQAVLVLALLAAAQAVRPWVSMAASLTTAAAAGPAVGADADTALALGKKKKHDDDDDGKPDKHPYTSPTGLFIQERASKQLPGPGQHFSFGALVSWDSIHALLDSNPDSKLVFLIRHGQAVSNFLSDSLGPDVWFTLESQCSYTDDNGTFWGIFDADLTDLGKDEARALNSMLKDGGWFDKLTGGRDSHTIVSPLSRCLETTLLALDGMPFTAVDVDENVRETLGEDTCDARRSAGDPQDEDPDHLIGPCQFTLGLRSKFPEFSFPISPKHGDKHKDEYDSDDSDLGAGAKSNGGGDGGRALTSGADAASRAELVKKKDKPERTAFGLFANADIEWTPDRETQAHQTKRAEHFLDDLFRLVEERVVFVVTHSGFTRSVLLAVGREPYRPQNTELVPIVIYKHDDDEQHAAAAAGRQAA